MNQVESRGASRVSWMVAGALVLLLIMAVASIVSRVITHDTSRACSPDGSICITREQAPRVLQVRLWVSVDLHDQCATEYPIPFRLPAGPLKATFGPKSVELEGQPGTRITYTARGC